MTEHVSLYTTAPDRDVARDLARALLEDELVACANAFPIESHYTWEGELVEEDEVAMILKTRRDLVDAVRGRIEELHPYDVPALVAWPIEDGLPAYLDWIADVTRS